MTYHEKNSVVELHNTTLSPPQSHSALLPKCLAAYHRPACSPAALCNLPTVKTTYRAPLPCSPALTAPRASKEPATLHSLTRPHAFLRITELHHHPRLHITHPTRPTLRLPANTRCGPTARTRTPRVLPTTPTHPLVRLHCPFRQRAHRPSATHPHRRSAASVPPRRPPCHSPHRHRPHHRRLPFHLLMTPT